MIRIQSKRFIKFIPTPWTTAKTFFGQGKGETEHKADQLPVSEREVFLRQVKRERRGSGFDWEDTGRSLLYNRERGWAYKMSTRTVWALIMDKCVTKSRIYEETQRDSRIIYTFRGQDGQFKKLFKG